MATRNYKQAVNFDNAPLEGNIVEGVIKRNIRFDSGYTILTVEDGKTGGKYTLVGEMQEFPEGMNIKATVTVTTHPKYGQQYKVVEIEESGFSSRNHLVNFLSSDHFKDIGPIFGGKIVDHFGMNALEIIDQSPEKLYDVPGLPDWRAKNFIDGWEVKRAYNKILGELVKWGLTMTQATKAYKHFGTGVLDILKNNYYQLIEIFGIGFETADKIALENGIDRNSLNRVIAAINFCLEKSTQSGHCYLPRLELINDVVKLLSGDVDGGRVGEGITALIKLNHVVQVDDNVYSFELYNDEQYVAEKLKKMISNKNNGTTYKSLENMESDMRKLNIAQNTELAIEQKQAIMNAINSRVSIMTGGPGVGKSFCTKNLCDILDHHNLTYELCSPTGRASKRLSEATKQEGRAEARTIHRMLGYNPTLGYAFNEQDNLMVDCVIVDEISMIDVSLMRHLLEALDSNTRLIMVGDADQLPSVGPGNVLKDLIDSGQIPVVRLKHIFRQDAGSTIVLAAHDILNGVIPDLPTPKESKGRSCMFVSADTIETAKEYIIRLAATSLPDIGFKPEEIQVLTPMRGKGLGVSDLNPELQKVFNPHKAASEDVQTMGKIFRVGDKVMQTRNNYDKGIFNGDIGIIKGFTKPDDEHIAHIEFDIGEIQYPFSEWDDLMHAYASTIHRSQGSEYPAVILVLHKSQSYMLARNLFYTGLTRAKKMCIIVSTQSALERAVTNNKEVLRNTGLCKLLQGE